jgi:hypothetical protein
MAALMSCGPFHGWHCSDSTQWEHPQFGPQQSGSSSQLTLSLHTIP